MQLTARQFSSWPEPRQARAIACLKRLGLRIPPDSCFCINAINDKVYSLLLEAKDPRKILILMLTQTFIVLEKARKLKICIVIIGNFYSDVFKITFHVNSSIISITSDPKVFYRSACNFT